MSTRVSHCPMCDGRRTRRIMCEINGVVDESMTRPCETCLGDGMVYIIDGVLIPWRKATRRLTFAT